MRQLDVFDFERELSQHVNDISRQMTELRKLRVLVRAAERRSHRLGIPSTGGPSCNANNSSSFASSTAAIMD
jgi:hypothetical protein